MIAGMFYSKYVFGMLINVSSRMYRFKIPEIPGILYYNSLLAKYFHGLCCVLLFVTRKFTWFRTLLITLISNAFKWHYETVWICTCLIFQTLTYRILNKNFLFRSCERTIAVSSAEKCLQVYLEILLNWNNIQIYNSGNLNDVCKNTSNKLFKSIDI